jgi:hypothetical protein
MTKAVEEARELLAKIEDSLPFTVNEVTNPDQNPVIATVRKVDGYPALAPHPESLSMLTGRREVFQFLVFGPRIMRELVELLETNEPEKADLPE